MSGQNTPILELNSADTADTAATESWFVKNWNLLLQMSTNSATSVSTYAYNLIIAGKDGIKSAFNFVYGTVVSAPGAVCGAVVAAPKTVYDAVTGAPEAIKNAFSSAYAYGSSFFFKAAPAATSEATAEAATEAEVTATATV